MKMKTNLSTMSPSFDSLHVAPIPMSVLHPILLRFQEAIQ